MNILIAVSCLVVIAICFVFLFVRGLRSDYMLKVTCNDLVVIQHQIVELEGLCDLKPNGVLKWIFFPPGPESESRTIDEAPNLHSNVVKIEIIRR